jgi:hypothetical protein
MKVKTFKLDSGKHVVVANSTKFNDTTKAEEESTIKTDEQPRPMLRDAIATLSLRVVEHYDLSAHKLKLYKIVFSENKDGKSAKFYLQTVGEAKKIPVGPLYFERAEEFQASSTVRVAESTQNTLYDQLEATEKLIGKYIEGDREQPLLVEKKEPEARPQLGFFDKAKAAVTGGRKKPAKVEA